MRRRRLVHALTLLAASAAASAENVLIWSYGTCATGTIAHVLRNSARLAYCNGNKEGFRPGSRWHKRKPPKFLTRENLAACAAEGPGRLTHVKPEFLGEASSEWDHGIISAEARRGGAMRTPEELMDAARASGFSVVAAVRRRNWLARAVSSWEKHPERSPEEARARFCCDAKPTPPWIDTHCNVSLAHKYESMDAFYRRGLRAAEGAGLRVVEVMFEELVADVCGAIARVTQYLGACGGGACPCQPQVPKKRSHVGVSRKHLGLAARTTPEAAACIVRDISASPSMSWMLDLNATGPP